MKLKAKIMASSSAMLIIVMCISTVAVSFLITRQNRTASHDLIAKSFTIIRENIAGIREKLLADTIQMATVSEMGTKIQFLAGEKGNDEPSLTESTYKEILQSLYNIGTSSKVDQIFAYDMEGDLTAFLQFGPDSVLLGYPLYGSEAAFAVMSLKRGGKLNQMAYKKAEAVQGIARKYAGDIPKTNGTRFEQVDTHLGLVGSAPSNALEYNVKTEQLEPQQVGFVIAQKTFSDEFTDRMSRLTGTQINIFTRNGLSAGTLKEHTAFTLPNSRQQQEGDPEIVFDDIQVGESEYFQGVFPVFSDASCIAAIVSLYSRKFSHNNSLQMVKMLILISALCILLLLPVAFLFANSLANPIRTVKTFAEQLRQGNLSARLPTRNDEIGEMSSALNEVVEALHLKANAASGIAQGDLNQEITVISDDDSLGKSLHSMVENLNHILANLYASAEKVAMGSQQVSNSSNSLSDGASRQASSIEEITSTMTEIGSQTKTNAENASQANQLATAARNAAASGVGRMETMIEAMSAINESSVEISKIIKTIDDIAFQTNLLALNAAVEAARAGKHGKGFAVVAQEVRSLASRSAKAASETAELIEQSSRKVETGNETVQQTSAVLSEINESVAKVADLVGEIAAASNEQSQGISQVNQGLSQIDDVTQQNTATAEETSALAQDLAAQADIVRQFLVRFQLKSSHATLESEVGERPTPRLPAMAEKPNDSWDGADEWGKASLPVERSVHPREKIQMDDQDFRNS